MDPILKLKRLPHGEGLPIPSYSTPGAAGMDICAASDGYVMDGVATVIQTGFAVEVPPGYELQVRSRSGLAAKHAVLVLNSPGTIDEDYRGEIMVIMGVTGPRLFTYSKGDRIAQLVLAPVTKAIVTEVEELSSTLRGEGGLGSTGR
jgi:dUTP pyrophosphatase